MSDPDLTREQIDRICAGLKQNAAKVRFLRRLGLTVQRRPDGSPLVNAKHYDAVRASVNSSRQATQPVGGPVWGVHK